jgi:Uma2 family endonuclease
MSDVPIQPQLRTDIWVAASWDEYLRTIADPRCDRAKGYYYQKHMRVEMLPVSFEHGKDHVVVIFAVNLFATLRGIPATGLDATSFRKAGIRECQPDVSYYLGDRARVIPSGTGIINLDQYPPPSLVIEIARTSLLDDIGTKRALYEDLGVSEYWVLDVQNSRVLAYAIAHQGSQRIQASQMLPGLEIAVLDEALQRSREVDQSQVGAWLLAQFR